MKTQLLGIANKKWLSTIDTDRIVKSIGTGWYNAVDRPIHFTGENKRLNDIAEKFHSSLDIVGCRQVACHKDDHFSGNTFISISVAKSRNHRLFYLHKGKDHRIFLHYGVVFSLNPLDWHWLTYPAEFGRSGFEPWACIQFVVPNKRAKRLVKTLEAEGIINLDYEVLK